MPRANASCTQDEPLLPLAEAHKLTSATQNRHAHNAFERSRITTTAGHALACVASPTSLKHTTCHARRLSSPALVIRVGAAIGCYLLAYRLSAPGRSTRTQPCTTHQPAATLIAHACMRVQGSKQCIVRPSLPGKPGLSPHRKGRWPCGCLVLNLAMIVAPTVKAQGHRNTGNRRTSVHDRSSRTRMYTSMMSTINELSTTGASA